MLAKDQSAAEVDRTFLGLRRSMLVPLVVACAFFMQMLDSTVIATALPTIARDFHKAPLVLKVHRVMGVTFYP